MAERVERVKIDADWVLKQAVKVHNRCMEEKEALTEYDGKERVPLKNEDGEYLYKFDSTGALKSLDLIGKHINIKAFDNKINIDGKIENEHTLTNNELSRKILHLLQKGQQK
jgi:phage terminase small subunit